MPASLSIDLRGENLYLHAQRAVYWPSRRRLLIADLHLGKVDHFRAAGIALPVGSTASDLERLTSLLAHTGATSLWILGDMLHGALTTTAWRAQWDAFRQQHAHMEVVLVGGNHDRAVRQPGLAQSLGIDRVVAQVLDTPFLLVHDAPMPDASDPSHGSLMMGGHWHPVVRVRGFRQRFAAFVLTPHQLVLPAFSEFTGGMSVPGSVAAWACMGDDDIVALPQR